MHKEGDQVVETPVEARQGFLDRPVVIVLVASCMLAVIFLALSYAGVFGRRSATTSASSLCLQLSGVTSAQSSSWSW